MIMVKKNGKYVADTEVTERINKYFSKEWFDKPTDNTAEQRKTMQTFPEKIYFHEAGFANEAQVLYKYGGRRRIEIQPDIRGTAMQDMRIETPLAYITAKLKDIFYYPETNSIIIMVGAVNDNTTIVITDIYICNFFKKHFEKTGLLK